MPSITEHDLDHWFQYHPPREGQRERYELIRAQAKTFARVVLDTTSPGADQSAAIRKIRETVFTANAAIALEGEVQSVYYAQRTRRRSDEE
jgi:hypothetical protein